MWFAPCICAGQAPSNLQRDHCYRKSAKPSGRWKCIHLWHADDNIIPVTWSCYVLRSSNWSRHRKCPSVQHVSLSDKRSSYLISQYRKTASILGNLFHSNQTRPPQKAPYQWKHRTLATKRKHNTVCFSGDLGSPKAFHQPGQLPKPLSGRDRIHQFPAHIQQPWPPRGLLAGTAASASTSAAALKLR